MFQCTVALFGVLWAYQLQFVSAQAVFCPMPIGTLGPMLKANVLVESCTYDNSTSSNPVPNCDTDTRVQKDFRRGEYDYLRRESLFVKLYGGDICFSYWMKSAMKGDSNETKEGCTSKCFSATSTSPPRLTVDVNMTCTGASCTGQVKYEKVTISKGGYSTSKSSTHCTPPDGKKGDGKARSLKVQDCLKVTAGTGHVTSERCDETVGIWLDDILAGKTNRSEDLVVSKNSEKKEFRIPPVDERIFATYNGGEEVCLAVEAQTVEVQKMVITTSDYTCDGGCAGDEKEKMLTYYKETINIVTENTGFDFSTTEKMIKFVSSSAVAYIQAPLATILLATIFVLLNFK